MGLLCVYILTGPTGGVDRMCKLLPINFCNVLTFYNRTYQIQKYNIIEHNIKEIKEYK